VARSWPNQSPYDDLPAYLIEPPPPHRDLHRLRDGVSRAYRRTTAPAQPSIRPAAPLGGRPPTFSPLFARMVPLRRGRVAAALDAWWPGEAKSGVVTVQHRLQLGPPEGDASTGWKMKGRVRRLTTLHWIPVVVELWANYEDCTRMTMTPQARVLVSRRYFRLGNSALDRLSAELAATSTDPDQRPRLRG
jgi:hypothetical protein